MLRRISLICAIFCAGVTSASGQQGLPDIEPTGIPYSIVISDAHVDGQSLNYGDEIGVFDGEQLVGRAVFNHNLPLVMTAWQGDVALGLAGFRPGNTMAFKVYTQRYGSWQLIDGEPNYSVGNGSFGHGSYTAVELSATTTAQPELDVSTSSIDFGSVRVGVEEKQTVVIRNSGSAPLSVYDIQGSSWQFWPDRHTFQLQPGGEVQINVSFVPSDAGRATGQLLIISDDPGAPRSTIDLQGRGLPASSPTLVVEPRSVEFGSVRAGQRAEQTIRLWNRGNDTLRIDGLSVYDPVFDVSSTDYVISPGDYREIQIGFQDAGLGLRQSQLVISSNHVDDNYFHVDLRAVTHAGYFERPLDTGLHYPIAFTEISVDNSLIAAGDEVALFANGLVVGHAAFDGSFPFVVTAYRQDAGRNLPGFSPGVPIEVRVNTRVYGEMTEVNLDRIRVETGDGTFGAGLFTALSADGMSGQAPVAATSFHTVQFNATTIGSSSEEVVRYLRNTGQNVLHADVSTSGDFSVRPAGSRSIAPGDSLPYYLRHHAQTVGLNNGHVHWYTNDPYARDIAVPLLGRALPSVPVERLEIHASDWLETEVNETGSSEIEIRNLFAREEIVSIAIESADVEAKLSQEKVSLGPNGHTRVWLSATPRAVGASEVQLSFVTADGSSQSVRINVLAHGGIFGSVTHTGQSYHIVIDELIAPGAPFEPGDEIAVFDGEALVGISYIRDGTENISVPVWKRDEGRGLPGYRDGAPIRLRFSKSTLGSEGKHTLEPYSVEFTGSGTFGEGSFQSARIVVREPIYFRSPERTVTYERDEFTTRTLAHLDSLVHAPNGQTLTHEFSWDAGGLAFSRVGNFVRMQLEPGFVGSVQLVHEASDGVETVTDTTWFNVVPPPPVNVTVDARAGWNMLGVSAEIDNPDAGVIFAGAIPGTVFGFNGVYQEAETLDAGGGYWARFENEHSIVVSGLTLREQILNLKSGWNLISGISSTVNVSELIDPSRAIIPGTLFAYEGAYASVDNLQPGKGYWLRASKAGEVIVREQAPQSSSKTLETEEATTSTIPARHVAIFTNGASSTSSLQFGLDDEVDNELYGLPPRPPAGAFDVRFLNETWMSARDTVDIRLQQSHDPVELTVSTSAATVRVEYYSGNALQSVSNVESDERLTIDPDVDRLRIMPHMASTSVESHIEPEEWALGHNYPNPFSASTHIPFEVPETAHVIIHVYDMLGRRVATPVDDTFSPGRHTIEFRPIGLAPGVYVYRLEANESSYGRMVITR